MMVNHMDDCDDYGEILLDSTEPFAKKIIECITFKESLEILGLTEKPTTVNEICAKTEHSRATIYRRISDMLDACLLIAVGREQSKENFGKVGAWIYEKSFYAVNVRCGPNSECCNRISTGVEILPKREFYGRILKTVRNYRL